MGPADEVQSSICLGIFIGAGPHCRSSVMTAIGANAGSRSPPLQRHSSRRPCPDSRRRRMLPLNAGFHFTCPRASSFRDTTARSAAVHPISGPNAEWSGSPGLTTLSADSLALSSAVSIPVPHAILATEGAVLGIRHFVPIRVIRFASVPYPVHFWEGTVLNAKG